MRLKPVVMGVALLALAGAASAAEIKVAFASPMRTTMTALIDQFQRTTAHRIVVIDTPSRFIAERLRKGEAMDVTILPKPTSAGLIKDGKLARHVDFARSSIGVAVLADAPKPDMSSADAVKRTLLAAKSFARNEGAESGVHMLSVFERLGIVEAMKAKTIAMPVNTGYVASLVANRKAEMAAQQMPELLAVPGVIATPLPPELNVEIVFAAGAGAGSGVTGAVDELLKFLTSPAAAPVLKKNGLEAF